MPRGITRKDYTLLRDGLAPDSLFGDEESGTKPKGATVWRLFGLANQEVLVSAAAEIFTALDCRGCADELQINLLHPETVFHCAGHYIGNRSSGRRILVYSGCSQACRGPH
jgi:hypothetical protein